MTVNQLKTEYLSGPWLKGKTGDLGCSTLVSVPALDYQMSCGLRDLLCTTIHPTRPPAQGNVWISTTKEFTDWFWSPGRVFKANQNLRNHLLIWQMRKLWPGAGTLPWWRPCTYRWSQTRRQPPRLWGWWSSCYTTGWTTELKLFTGLLCI